MTKTLFAWIVCACSLLSTCAIAKTQHDVKAIAFDFGGVIATVDRARMIQFFIDTFQLSEEELKPAFSQWKLTLAKGESEKEFWKSYAESLGVALPENWFDEFDRVTGFTDIPGMIAIVKSLQEQGYQTTMLSNIQEYQANVVRRFDYYGLFEPVLLSYEIGFEKPRKEAFQILLDRLNISASELIFIDDQKENVDAAKALGIDAIHFASPQQLVEELQKSQHRLHWQYHVYTQKIGEN